MILYFLLNSNEDLEILEYNIESFIKTSILSAIFLADRSLIIKPLIPIQKVHKLRYEYKF